MNSQAVVLVVEHNCESAQALAGLLRIYSFEPVVVESAQAALEFARKGAADTVVIAFDIPGGAFELAQELAKLPGYVDVPLVISAAEEIDEATKIEALYYGAFGWLRRPYDDFDVMLTISNMVRIHSLRNELQQKVEELDLLASTDTLTGLFNRRFFMRRLDEEVARANRLNSPLCLIYVDIDHFKSINDSHGHQVGDEVLRRVAGVMARLLRKSDIIGRVGGEEFLILLPGSDTQEGLLVAERLRAAVQQAGVKLDELEIVVTISAGLTSQNGPRGSSTDDLIRTSDEALYEAKHGGRNRVVVSRIGSQAS